MDIETLWDDFFFHLKLKNRAEHTIRYYRTTRNMHQVYREATQSPSDTAQINVMQLRRFLLWLKEERGLQPGGLHAHGRAIRALFKWAFKEEVLPSDPSARLELPRVPRERQPTVTEKHIQALLEAAKGLDQPYRDTAMILTLYDTGIRCQEFVGLSVNTLMLEKGLLLIHGKGDKDRVVPIGSKAMQAIVRYIRREREPGHEGISALFLNRHGEPLTRFGVSIRLATLAKNAGLARELCAPHAFRRGFAVQFLRNGGDVFTLQQIMGHTSLDMTRRYVNLLDDDLKKAHLRLSPADRMK